MSQSPIVASSTQPWNASPTAPTLVDTDEGVQRLLAVLDDADCRTILEATTEDSLSANELSEACDVPLSTLYRKLDLLTDAGLLKEGTRLRRSGKHASEYSRVVEEIAVSVTLDGGFELLVTPRVTTDEGPRTQAL